MPDLNSLDPFEKLKAFAKGVEQFAKGQDITVVGAVGMIDPRSDAITHKVNLCTSEDLRVLKSTAKTAVEVGKETYKEITGEDLE